MQPYVYTYPSMGTEWRLTIWDALGEGVLDGFCREAQKKSEAFDADYSRFKSDSFVSHIKETVGVVEVPLPFMEMLNWYRFFYAVSGRKLTPTMGYALSDLGYDETYSLIPKAATRKVPDLFDSVRIVDESHIEIKEPILFDFGALGKGYFVDILFNYLKEVGLQHFLVDGSGDVRFVGSKELRIGLEDPRDEKRAIGIVSLKEGALCGSGVNRRVWEHKGEEYNHYIDPTTGKSPTTIMATWVLAEKAVVADAIASVLFFVSPESLSEIGIPFEYLVVNHEGKAKSSAGFPAELF